MARTKGKAKRAITPSPPPSPRSPFHPPPPSPPDLNKPPPSPTSPPLSPPPLETSLSPLLTQPPSNPSDDETLNIIPLNIISEPLFKATPLNITQTAPHLKTKSQSKPKQTKSSQFVAVRRSNRIRAGVGIKKTQSVDTTVHEIPDSEDESNPKKAVPT